MSYGPRATATRGGWSTSSASTDTWLGRYEPDVVAVEQVFADTNITTVMTTAHATAVALLTATKRGIPVVFHTPTEVKAAVTGSGRAGKAQVTAMVTRILGLEVAPRPRMPRTPWPSRSATRGAAPRLARLDALAAAQGGDDRLGAW